MDDDWLPPLELTDVDRARCRLGLGGWVHGEGTTLQEAADDLLARVVLLAEAIRAGGVMASAVTGPPDPHWAMFFWQLGEAVARGDDIRARIFGRPHLAA